MLKEATYEALLNDLATMPDEEVLSLLFELLKEYRVIISKRDALFHELSIAIDQEEYEKADRLLSEAERRYGSYFLECVRYRTTLSLLKD